MSLPPTEVVLMCYGTHWTSFNDRPVQAIESQPAIQLQRAIESQQAIESQRAIGL